MGGMPGRFPMLGGMPGGMGGGVPTDVKEYVIAEWLARPAPSGRQTSDQAPVTEPYVQERVRKLRQILDRLRADGRRPDYFWPPERERQLRGFLEAGQFAQANELLDAALRDYKRGPPR